jgi:hypothetical protein
MGMGMGSRVWDVDSESGAMGASWRSDILEAAHLAVLLIDEYSQSSQA